MAFTNRNPHSKGKVKNRTIVNSVLTEAIINRLYEYGNDQNRSSESYQRKLGFVLGVLS